jgi:hypothetical protein
LRPLRIRANLSTAVRVDNPFGFIPLDEIIVEAVLRRSLSGFFSPTNPDLVIPSLTTEDSVEDEHRAIERLRDDRRTLRMPPAQRDLHEAIALARILLARGGSGQGWHWRASFSFCARLPRRVRGRASLLNASSLDWWCTGAQEQIKDLLANVHTIGIRRGGHGRVRSWQVLPTKGDWAVWRTDTQQLMRSVPYVQVPDDLRWRYWPAVWGLRPPYAHPANQAQVALPFVVGTAIDTHATSADILQWNDLTLHRKERRLICRG